MKIDSQHNHVTLFVCLDCNRNCLECSQRGLRRWNPEYQMSLKHVQEFIDCTKQSDYESFKSIIISGGEPLLWRHLHEGVRMLKESGLSERVNVFSNGLNTEAVTQELLDNLTTLRLSKYAGNQNQLTKLVERFGTDHITVVDRTNHTPIPTRLLDGVLPAKCGCEGYALWFGFMYACPMIQTVASELDLDLADYPETFCTLRSHWAEALDKFDRANHELCRGCIGNHRVRAQQAKIQTDRESIPVRQEAVWNLHDFSKIMHRAEIPFCLVAGTLLGAYREGDFLKGDEDDIDVAVPAEDFERIDTVKAALEQKGFQNHKRFVVKGVLEAVGYKRGKNHLDISAMHIRDGKAFCYGRSFNKHKLPPIFAYVFPAKCFERFDGTTLHGIDCAIPAHTEDYLSAKYIDWETPTDRQHYDYLDVKQSPCVDGSGWWEEG